MPSYIPKRQKRKDILSARRLTAPCSGPNCRTFCDSAWAPSRERSAKLVLRHGVHHRHLTDARLHLADAGAAEPQHRSEGRGLTADADEEHALPRLHYRLRTYSRDTCFQGLTRLARSSASDGVPYTVIGVSRKAGQHLRGQSQDNWVGVPLTTYPEEATAPQKSVIIYIKAAAMPGGAMDQLRQRRGLAC